MRFAHLADIHIGSWRDPKLKELTTLAFAKAIDRCLHEKVDFVLISGDLFNTAIPAVEHLKTAVKKLRELKEAEIPVYGIAGSHDFSSSGRTMLDIIEEAGLFKNVARGVMIDERLKLRFTIDPKTGVKLTGIIGKKGGLEKEYYKLLDKKSLEQEPGKKIFLFHTALNELKPKELELMEANPISLFPKGFDYYAGGHVHIVESIKLDGYPEVVYPGPMYPNNFAELEKLEGGGFYLVTLKDDGVDKEYVLLDMPRAFNIKVNAEHKTPSEIEKELDSLIESAEISGKIVTIRCEGCLKSGKPSDIDFNKLFNQCAAKGAFFVMKNTVKLTAREFEAVHVARQSAESVEERLIKEHAGQFKLYKPEEEIVLVKTLLQELNVEKVEGERVVDFEEKLKQEVGKVFLR